MRAFNQLTRLAGASVLSMAAMATTVQAELTDAERDAWQLSQTPDINHLMSWAELPLFKAVLNANGGDKAAALGSRAGFATELTEASENPSPRPRKVFYPNPDKMRVSTANFVIGGILPPNSRVDTIPVCIEQNNEIKATFQITALGKVEPVQWSGPTHAEAGKTACGPYFNQRVRDLGYLPSQQPTQPVATAQGNTQASVITSKPNTLASAP